MSREIARLSEPHRAFAPRLVAGVLEGPSFPAQVVFSVLDYNDKLQTYFGLDVPTEDVRAFAEAILAALPPKPEPVDLRPRAYYGPESAGPPPDYRPGIDVWTRTPEPTRVVETTTPERTDYARMWDSLGPQIAAMSRGFRQSFTINDDVYPGRRRIPRTAPRYIMVSRKYPEGGPRWLVVDRETTEVYGFGAPRDVTEDNLERLRAGEIDPRHLIPASDLKGAYS